MAKVVLFTRDDGGLSVFHPAESSRLALESEDEFATRMAARVVPAGVGFVVTDAANVPADRSFRDAWKIAGKGVGVDMAKARGIHRDRLRTMRKPLLDALDVDYQRADERGDAAAKAAIAKRKQLLRDVTTDLAIDAAETPDALAAAAPEALTR